MYLEETCVVDLIVRPSVGRGLRLEDVSWGTLCCLLTCKALGGSRVKTPRCILRNLVLLTNCQAFGVARVQARRCILGNLCCLLHCKAVGGPRG